MGRVLGRGRRRPGFTGRAAVLAGIVLVLATTLVLPLQEFFSQRGQMAELRAQTAAQERRVAELERQKELWKDPAYVAAQARERLHFVRPGESKVIVLSPEEAPAPGANSAPGNAMTEQRPWYERLWQSVQAADDAAPEPGPPGPGTAPAERPAGP